MPFDYITPRFELGALTKEVNTDLGVEVGKFSGLASTYGNMDYANDIIDKGAFEQTTAKGVRMLHAHDTREVIGLWKSIRNDDRGLHVDGEINLDVQRGREAYSLMKMGALTDLSVGFRVPKGGFHYDEQEDGTYVRHIKKADLFEISIVAIGCNPKAKIEAVKEFNSEDCTERQLEGMLRELCGMSRRDAQAFLSGGFKALTGRTATPPTEATTTKKRSDAIANALAIRALADSILQSSKSMGG